MVSTEVCCKCGCGEMIHRFNKKYGYERKYINGHGRKDGKKYLWRESMNEKKSFCECGCGNEMFYLTLRGKIRRFVFGHKRINREKYPINIDYFKKLNKRNAYVLGYLFADGHLHETVNKTVNSFSLSFSSIDRELIDKINFEFSNGKRRIRILKHDKKYPNRKQQYKMSITSYPFSRFLINLGMQIGKKEDKIVIPESISKDKNFFFSFCRGYFDGDGYVSLRYRKGNKYPSCGVTLTTISYEFLKMMKNLMFKFNIISGSIRKCKDVNAFRLSFYGKQNVYNLYKLMYQNSNGLFLNRKKQRFDEYFKAYNWKTI